jgi:transposase-like protein
MNRHRFDRIVDHSDDTRQVSASARPRRIEVITGVERRRKWSAQEEVAIVAESLAEGAVISEVARRHGLSPQQLFGWSRAYGPRGLRCGRSRQRGKNDYRGSRQSHEMTHRLLSSAGAPKHRTWVVDRSARV